jgi:hypothetical protein
MSVDWTEVMAFAESIGGIAVAASLLFVVYQLRGQRKEQFVIGSADLFDIWADDDFQKAIQWILYDMRAITWREFVAKYRGQYGERALNRVGAFYNRVGYLVTRDLLGGLDQLIIEATASTAIKVWHKIEPLVLEARLIENSSMYQDFERMLPECFECYVPGQIQPGTESTIAREIAQAIEATTLSSGTDDFRPGR